MRRVPRIVPLAVLTLALTAASYPAVRGGWSILTVHELPNSLEVGRPTTLTFSLRQHGQELLAGRAPVLQLRRGSTLTGERQDVRAERTAQPGVYRATFTPSAAGEHRISIDTDFYNWVARLLPLRASVGPVEMSAESRGRALYVAKGCVGCHTKSDDNALDEFQEMHVGPELTGRSFPTPWLVQKITDPASLRAAGARPMNTMPQLEVTRAEAEAIATYLNTRIVAARD